MSNSDGSRFPTLPLICIGYDAGLGSISTVGYSECEVATSMQDGTSKQVLTAKVQSRVYRFALPS